MAALFDRVQMTLNKRGSATMKPTSFCDEPMIRLASQGFKKFLCLSPEKPRLSHNFENLFEKLQLLIYRLSTSEVGIEPTT